VKTSSPRAKRLFVSRIKKQTLVFSRKKEICEKKQLVKNNNAKKEESKKHSLFLLLYQFGTKLASSFYFPSVGFGEK
jgi:hypothetical protein